MGQTNSPKESKYERARARGPQPADADSAVPGDEPRSPTGAKNCRPALVHAAIGLALAIAILLAWSNSLDSGFIYDNRAIILLDSRVHSATLENFGQILSTPYWPPPWNSNQLYRPVTTLSYLFNYAILGNGEAPAPYHWINLFLHILNALLLYALALRLRQKRWVAAFAAAAWSLHPVTTEAVTNIVGRADLLATMATLSALLLYLKSTEATGRSKMLWLAGVMLATTVGVFSKESAAAIPGLVLLYEIAWPRKEKRLQALGFAAAAVVPPMLLMAWGRAVVLTASAPAFSFFTDNPIVATTFIRGRLTALAVMAKCLWLLAWPLHLSADYSYNQVPLITGSLQDWLALATVLAVAAAMAGLYKVNRAAFFFAGFGMVAFMPVSNLFIPIGTIMAERLLYMPAIGFACVLVVLADRASKAVAWKAAFPAALCVILGLYGARTWTRNLDWRDAVTLWSAAVQISPNSYRTHYELATALDALNSDHLDPAQTKHTIDETDKFLAILDPVPDSMNSGPTYVFAGLAYLRKGDSLLRRGPHGEVTTGPDALQAYGRARQLLNRAADIGQTFDSVYQQEARARGHVDSGATGVGQESLYYALAIADIRLKRFREATDAASHAAKISPQFADAYLAAGTAQLTDGHAQEAAISLMQGLLISDNQQFLPLLREVYRRDGKAIECAFPSGSVFPDPSCPIVHADICNASSHLIQGLTDAREQAMAAEIKKQATETSGCSPNELKID